MTAQPRDLDGLEADSAELCAAVSDVRPQSFRDRIEHHLRGASSSPSLLVALSARLADNDAPPETIARRGTGVQLIYEGLALTRALARAPPWSRALESEADLEILVAEVMVARGMSLLARSEAVDEAVETVRTLGYDETIRRTGESDPGRPNYAFEADVFELGIVAGITATGADRPKGVRAFAEELAGSLEARQDDLDRRLSRTTVEELETLVSESA